MCYFFLGWASGVSEHHWILPFPSSDFVRLPISFLGLGCSLEVGHSHPGESFGLDKVDPESWAHTTKEVRGALSCGYCTFSYQRARGTIWRSGEPALVFWVVGAVLDSGVGGFCHRMQNAGLDPSRQRQLFSLRANNQERDFSPILVFYAKSNTLRFGPAAFFFFFQWQFQISHSFRQKQKDINPALEINVSPCVLFPAFSLFAVLVVGSLYFLSIFFSFFSFLFLWQTLLLVLEEQVKSCF